MTKPLVSMVLEQRGSLWSLHVELTIGASLRSLAWGYRKLLEMAKTNYTDASHNTYTYIKTPYLVLTHYQALVRHEAILGQPRPYIIALIDHPQPGILAATPTPNTEFYENPAQSNTVTIAYPPITERITNPPPPLKERLKALITPIHGYLLWQTLSSEQVLQLASALPNPKTLLKGPLTATVHRTPRQTTITYHKGRQERPLPLTTKPPELRVELEQGVLRAELVDQEALPADPHALLKALINGIT